MFQRLISEPQYERHRVLVVLIAVILIPVISAGWLSGFKLFAFPFGTFLVGLIVPLLLIVIAFVFPNSSEEEPEEI